MLVGPLRGAPAGRMVLAAVVPGDEDGEPCALTSVLVPMRLPGQVGEPIRAASPGGQQTLVRGRLSGDYGPAPLLEIDASGRDPSRPYVLNVFLEAEDERLDGDFLLAPRIPGVLEFDARSFSMVNPATARRVTGRQDFPELFEAMGAVCVGAASQLEELRALVAEGRFTSLEIESPEYIDARDPWERWLASVKAVACSAERP